MDWIVQINQDHQTQLTLLKKLDKITLYDHNSVLKTDVENLTFTCVLNCKRLNRQYSILGKIQGDLMNHTIKISCALVDFNRIVTGKWQHQKIELTKFAYRYNQKSARNISASKATEDTLNYQIKVNPLSGEFYVCYHFLLGFDLIKDYDKFKMKMTDECQKLTSEAEKIFNTVIEVIFDQQANDPYLKSDEKVGMHFSRPVKVSKLLKKIKKLNTVSSAYKIKNDISVQNKYRSVFKKVYLRKNEKTINNPLIIDNALLFIPKFCKKHLDALPDNAPPAKKKNLIISPFEDLDESHQLQFATRHLQDFSKGRGGEAVIQLTNTLTPQQKQILMKPGIYNVRGIMIRVEAVVKQRNNYEYDLLSNKLGFKYQYITQYYIIKQPRFAGLRLTQYLGQIPLQEYMQRFGYTLSLSNRLDIMTQICHVIQVLHRFNIGYFLNLKNVYITDKAIIKIRDFTSAYSICCWDQTKSKEIFEKKFLMDNAKDFLVVCGIDSLSKDKMEEQKEKEKTKLESERADVFSLGMVLYRVLMDKFPFSPNCISILQQNYRKVEQFLNEIWTVQTQFFLRQGGMIVKLLGHLLLKSLNMETDKRPYVEWLTVILSEVKTSLDCLY